MPEKTLEDKVITWLGDESESYSYEKVFDEVAVFKLRVTHLGAGQEFGVINPKNRPDTLVLGVWNPISLYHMAVMKVCKDDKYLEFLLDFKITLTNRRPHLQIQMTDNRIRSFVLTFPLYEDGLNKNIFFCAIADLLASSLIGNWKIQQYFGLPVEARSGPVRVMK